MRRLLPAVVVAALLGGPGCAARTAAPPAVAPVPTTAAAATYSTGVSWVDRSAEYQAIVRQVYRQATLALEASVAGRIAGTWAVILDADETVLSNLVYQQELERAGLTHTADRWKAWVERREAMPLPGAKAFLDRVRALGGRIAIVTNRLESECDDTRAVFAAHALVHDGMLCRPDGSPSDKNPRFEAVAVGAWPGGSGPVEVVMWLGDNIHDFPELSQDIRDRGDAAYTSFGTRFFALPNPMYGSWQ